MRVDLKFEVKTMFGGNVMTNESTKLFGWSAVSEVLGGTTKYFKPVKAWAMGVELQRDKTLDLDISDLNDLYKEIEESNLFNNISNTWKGQICLAIEEAKKKSDAKTVSEEKPKKK